MAHALRMILAAAVVLLLLTVHAVVAVNDSMTLNNDEQLNFFTSTLVYRAFVDASPVAFDSNNFLLSLFTLYQSTFQSQVFPSLDRMRLRMWCGWPNMTYDSATRYCATGAGLVNTYQYVLVEYAVSPSVTVDESALAKYGTVQLNTLGVVSNSGRPYPLTMADQTAILYDPDTFRDDGYGFVGAVVQNTVVVWVVFALILALLVGIIVGCCCWCRRRDRLWGEKNHNMIRSAFVGFRLHHGQDHARGEDEEGSRHRRRRHRENGGGVGAGRYREISDVNSTAAHYNLYADEDDDGAMEDRAVTSRASEFWPGVSAKGDEEEMTVRRSIKARKNDFS